MSLITHPHVVPKPQNLNSPSWELELRPLGVATGNALSVTRSEDTYEKTPPVGRRQPMTSLPACHNISAAERKHHQLFSSSLTGLFEACRVNLVRVQFSNSTMASTSKAFRKCVDPCPRYLTPDDTHDCCVFCLGMEHARDVLEGAVCVHCERLSMRKLSSRLSLFSRKEGQPSASRDSRPTVAEARRWNRGVRSWMWPISWKGTAPFSRVGREREWAAGLWWCDLSDIIRCSS